LEPDSVRTRMCAEFDLLALLVVPHDSLDGGEPSFEGFANLFPEVRSSAGVAGVSVIFLILASLSALPSLFISAAIYHILKDRGAAGEDRLLYDARDLLYLCR
jgi:hypothetical protein